MRRGSEFMECVGMTTLWLGRHVAWGKAVTCHRSPRGWPFSAFLLRMQFVIVSEVDLVDKLREL